MKNERTSARVARIAAKVMVSCRGIPSNRILVYERKAKDDITWGHLRALAASCLTQTADKPKKAKK